MLTSGTGAPSASWIEPWMISPGCGVSGVSTTGTSVVGTTPGIVGGTLGGIVAISVSVGLAATGSVTGRAGVMDEGAEVGAPGEGAACGAQATSSTRQTTIRRRCVLASEPGPEGYERLKRFRGGACCPSGYHRPNRSRWGRQAAGHKWPRHHTARARQAG